MKASGALCLMALVAVVPRAGYAQSDTKTAVADALYRQARDLMAAGKYAEACPKFAESQRLDPATGTLLNLAACHEKQGRLATAWIEYSDAMVAARRDGREDRVEYARARAAELEPRLSRLTLLLDASADEPELMIEIDGASVGRAVIGAATPVDPGKHSIRASAPGKKPWTGEVEIGVEADQKSLTIPPLELAPPEPPPPSAATPPVMMQTPGMASDELTSRPIPTSVYIAAGVTLALTASAGITGVSYLGKRSDYQETAEREGDSAATRQQRQSANRMGYINGGLWAGALVGAGVTTVLYVTRPERPSSARLLPVAGPGVAGLSLTGEF
jgi:hypothetical protein